MNMERINIIYVDDQREVLTTIGKELEDFEEFFNLESCESADEAWELLEEIDINGDYTAVLISDHIMPGKRGVDFLTEVDQDFRFDSIKKILLTGMATHQDTIAAINNASIDRYLEKPWKAEELVKMVRELLTIFVLEVGIDFERFRTKLDQEVVIKEYRKGREY